MIKQTAPPISSTQDNNSDQYRNFSSKLLGNLFYFHRNNAFEIQTRTATRTPQTHRTAPHAAAIRPKRCSRVPASGKISPAAGHRHGRHRAHTNCHAIAISVQQNFREALRELLGFGRGSVGHRSSPQLGSRGLNAMPVYVPDRARASRFGIGSGFGCSRRHHQKNTYDSST